MIFRFADCALDIGRRELRRAGTIVALEPQVFDLLAHLVSHRDRVVTKEEINAAIWGGRIVSEAALSSRISSVRQAIGDDGRHQSMVQTAHGRGFRFIAAVTTESDRASPDATERKPRERPIVAVLPFENLSGDPREEYFSDGLTADIVARLARHRWLSLVARNTMAQYKGRATGIADLARETGAAYVVEGSVRRSSDRVRVNAQLIDAQNGSCIWTERYERGLRDIFDVQDDITQTIAARIEPEIGNEERRRIAVELNPSFAAAHCGFADSLTYLGRYDEAIARFEKAIGLSTNDPQRWAFFTYGALALILKKDFERALEWTERASEIPNRQYWTLAHKAVALAYLGRSEEARHALDAAVAEQPELSVGFARKKMYFLKRSEQLEFYLEGLKQAGARN